MVFVDADKPSTAGLPEAFLAAGGQILTWRPGLTLEDEIFRHLSDQALDALLAKAETIVGAEPDECAHPDEVPRTYDTT